MSTGDWSPATFAENGERLLRAIRDHQESIRSIPVARRSNPREVLAAVDTGLPETGEEFDNVLSDTMTKVVPDLVQWNHPAFFGYFPTSASSVGILAETLTAALNVNAMLWSTSPAASALERVVLGWLAELAGYPRTADGVLLSGASLATLYALTAARDAAFGSAARTAGIVRPGLRTPRVYASDQAHSSVDKAAMTLGFGLGNVVRVPSDTSYRMRPDLLESAIVADLAGGALPVAVVATVGSTSVGAADPIEPIARICAEYGVWLHVDAAYGGFYRLATSLRGRTEDLSVGDSLVVNPQKTLFVPMDSTALYCRRAGALAATFRLVPDYLTASAGPDSIDYMDLSPQLGRGFRALKLWWVIRTFGRAGLAARLDHAVTLADRLRAEVDRHPDWRRIGGSDFPLVCLRYEPYGRLPGADRCLLDRLNAAIVEAVNEGGHAYVSHSRVADGYLIRVSIGNVHTLGADVTRLWEVLTKTAERRLSAVLRDGS